MLGKTRNTVCLYTFLFQKGLLILSPLIWNNDKGVSIKGYLQAKMSDFILKEREEELVIGSTASNTNQSSLQSSRQSIKNIARNEKRFDSERTSPIS